MVLSATRQTAWPERAFWCICYQNLWGICCITKKSMYVCLGLNIILNEHSFISMQMTRHEACVHKLWWVESVLSPLNYHAENTKSDTLPSHTILTLSQPDMFRCSNLSKDKSHFYWPTQSLISWSSIFGADALIIRQPKQSTNYWAVH